MQKYIHLVQIVETEKVAANQLRTQLEDQDTEIERLKAEVMFSVTHYRMFYIQCLVIYNGFMFSTMLSFCDGFSWFVKSH